MKKMENLYNKPNNEHIYKDLEKLDKYKNIKIPINNSKFNVKEVQNIVLLFYTS